MSVKTDLIAEFNDQLTEVGKLDVGSEKYKIGVDGVVKLADRIIEIEKFESETDLKKTNYEEEVYRNDRQFENEEKDRKVRNAIEIAKVGISVASLGLTATAFVMSMNFEKNGHLFGQEGSKAALRGILKFGK